jgi:hypothetical protein
MRVMDGWIEWKDEGCILLWDRYEKIIGFHVKFKQSEYSGSL